MRFIFETQKTEFLPFLSIFNMWKRNFKLNVLFAAQNIQIHSITCQKTSFNSVLTKKSFGALSTTISMKGRLSSSRLKLICYTYTEGVHSLKHKIDVAKVLLEVVLYKLW